MNNITTDRFGTLSLSQAIEFINNSNDNNRNIIIKSGIEALDSLINGWRPGELTVFGARPAMGKTNFIVSCIGNIVSSGTPVALFSAVNSLNLNFLSRIVSAIRCESIPYTDEEKKDMVDKFTNEETPLYMGLNPSLTMSYIKDNLTTLVREKGVRCVFIETIQSIFASERNGFTREGMDKICHELKMMAEKLQVPIIVTSELSRAVAQRPSFDGRIPQIADLRSCSSIETEADNVYLFWRPEYYHIYMDENGNDMRGIGNIIIAKNKNGVLGTLYVKYNTLNFTLEDLDGNKRWKLKMEKEKQKLIDHLKSSHIFTELSDKLDLEVSD